jgi:hypothetical protein
MTMSQDEDTETVVLLGCPTGQIVGCWCPFCDVARAERARTRCTSPHLGDAYLERLRAAGDAHLERLRAAGDARPAAEPDMGGGLPVASQGFHWRHGNPVCDCGALAGTHQSERSRAARGVRTTDVGAYQCALTCEDVLGRCRQTWEVTDDNSA